MPFMGFRGVTNAVGEMEEYAALNNIEILLFVLVLGF